MRRLEAAGRGDPMGKQVRCPGDRECVAERSLHDGVCSLMPRVVGHRTSKAEKGSGAFTGSDRTLPVSVQPSRNN